MVKVWEKERGRERVERGEEGREGERGRARETLNGCVKRRQMKRKLEREKEGGVETQGWEKERKEKKRRIR